MVQPQEAKRSVTPGEIVVLAAGGFALIFSFFPWFKSNFGHQTVNAWDSGLFPLATLIAIAGTVMALQVLLDRVLTTSLPAAVGEFTWEQIHIFLALLAFLIVFCYLLVDKSGAGFDFGFYLELFASIGLVVGAFLIRAERRALPVGAPGDLPNAGPPPYYTPPSTPPASPEEPPPTWAPPPPSP